MICVRGSTIERFVKSDGVYCLGRGVGIIRTPKAQRFIDQFYKWNLHKFQGDVTGSTFPNWDKEMISKFKILVPQENTIIDFEETVSLISGHLELKYKEKSKMQEFKGILLSKLATK